ncbi:MAG: hypothetical protein HZA32_10420 [Opitutae bacterium]|nr:hypothetical protein [Opitutae bacterium]
MDNLNRLAKAGMQRHRVDYAKALSLLEELRFHLICPPAAARRAEYQAALLTAVNAGKRAFLGGVTAQVPEGITCILPGWQGQPLSCVAHALGASVVTERPDANKTVWFGEALTSREDDLVLLADGWRGGFVPAGLATSFAPGEGFALGGVLAAGITVARCFLDVAGLALGVCDRPFGLSLWSPAQSWLDSRAAGPALTRLPEKVWLLGLGHLGQAYLWTLGLLPYPAQSQALLFLHDYDVITSGNWSAGLLCEPAVVTALKTRTCAAWAEARGFRTKLIERAFDANTRVSDDEPRIALCGFDSATGRRDLEAAGFDLVVECGLGSSLDQFDRLLLHTFPDASKHPRDLWPETARPEASDFDPALFGAELEEGECGVVLETLARKPISASFVGVTAAALVVAELLRGLHGGQRCELLRLHLRGDDSLGFASRPELYQRRHAANGTLRPAA